MAKGKKQDQPAPTTEAAHQPSATEVEKTLAIPPRDVLYCGGKS